MKELDFIYSDEANELFHEIMQWETGAAHYVDPWSTKQRHVEKDQKVTGRVMVSFSVDKQSWEELVKESMQFVKKIDGEIKSAKISIVDNGYFVNCKTIKDDEVKK